MVNAVLDDWESAPVDVRLKAALTLLEAITRRPQEIDSRLIAELESGGLGKPEFEEIAAVAFQFNFINRVADAIDFPIPNAKQKSRQARLLNFVARLLTGGKRPAPPWKVGADGLIRPAELDLAREQLLSYAGSVDPELRRSIEAMAAAQWTAVRLPREIPEELDDYVKPLSLHAYQIHDELVAKMKAAGHTEEQIFEVTLIGSFGAALAGQERLFLALYGGPKNKVTQATAIQC